MLWRTISQVNAVFSHLGVIWLRNTHKKSHTRGSKRIEHFLLLGMAFYLFRFSGGIYSKRSFKSQSKA